MVAHGYFSRFWNRIPGLPVGGLKPLQFLGSLDFSPISHCPIGIQFGTRFLLINAHGCFSHFSLAVIFLLIFLEMLVNHRCCFSCAHRWRWCFPGRCAIASVHEIRVPFLGWSIQRRLIFKLADTYPHFRLYWPHSFELQGAECSFFSSKGHVASSKEQHIYEIIVGKNVSVFEQIDKIPRSVAQI